MILIDVKAQIFTFFLSVILGLIFCLIYDLLRVLHKYLIKGFFEVFIIDTLYAVACSVTTFCFLIIRCSGIVRGYVLFGVALGFIVSRLTLSKAFFKIFSYVFKIFIAILHFVKRKFNAILVPLTKYFKNYALNVKKVLQRFINMMYNQLKTMGQKSKKEREFKNGNRSKKKR